MTRVVVAEGVAATRSAALDDARAQAVRQAVGAYVVTRTRVSMSEITEQTILSLSDGSITSTEVLSERVDEQGLHRIRILAIVADDRVIEDLMRRENATRPVVTDPEGARRTSAARRLDAAAFLRDTIRQSGYPLGMFSVDVRTSSPIRVAGQIQSYLELTIRVDDRRWSAFRENATRALAALGAMNGEVRWRPRPAGARQPELEARAPIVGFLMGREVTARLGAASRATLPGPLDNVVVPTDALAADRTIMFIEGPDESCDAFTLSGEAFDEIAPVVTDAATRQPTLRITFVDQWNEPIESVAMSLALNFSTGVLLLAEVDRGVPSRIRSGAARLLEDGSFSPTRPLQIVPAIGLQGVLVRELTLRCDEPIPMPAGTAGVSASLEW